MDHRANVRSIVEKVLNRKCDLRSFGNHESLVLSGRLDSFDVLDIVMFLEQQHGIDFGDRPFDQQMVDSVDEISALIEGSMQRGN